MNAIGWLLSLVALDAAQGTRSGDEAWRELHRRSDVPPLEPRATTERGGIAVDRRRLHGRSPSTMGALARR